MLYSLLKVNIIICLFCSYLMELVLEYACKYNVGDCQAVAVDRYSRWRQNPEDLREPEMYDINILLNKV